MIDMTEGHFRKNKFKRNIRLEALLHEVNMLLTPAEEKLCNGFQQPQLPLLFIVGVPRSGTTLLLQWLAATGYFGYITNFNSRFYRAPALGAKIQQMLLDPDYAFQDELKIPDDKAHDAFHSELGKTKGLTAPNEFWYFWRRFFHFNSLQILSKAKLNEVNMSLFAAELAAMENVFNKPLVMKALMLNWHLPLLANHLNQARFIFIKRDPLYNMQSLLMARKKYFGSFDSWYSFKPAEYNFLKNLSPCHQVAGQVYYTNRSVSEGLSVVDDNRKLCLNYEEFCDNPQETWFNIQTLLKPQIKAKTLPYRGPRCFRNTNHIIPEMAVISETMISAWKELFETDIKLKRVCK